MSFDKIEVRVFSGPDQVQVGSNTEPDLIVMNIGPKGDTGATGNTGATGPAGPNSVTSATTSDGTGQIMLDTLAVGTCNILDEVVFDTLTYTFAEGSAQALKDALSISFADVSDAQTGTADLILENLTATNLGSVTASIGSSLVVGDGDSVNGRYDIFSNTSHFQWYSDSVLYGERSFTITTENLTSSGSYSYKYPVGTGTLALTANINGEPDKLTGGTISGATTFNSSSFTYGSGVAAAHRTALAIKAVFANADESKTPNNTNYIDDAELFLTLEAGTWHVQVNAFWSNADNTVGMRAQVAFSGTMDTTKSPIIAYSGSSTDSNSITMTSANSRPVGALTSTMPRAVLVSATGRNGMLQTDHTVSVSVAGTYRLQWGQGTASGSLAAIRKAGSFIRATKLD